MKPKRILLCRHGQSWSNLDPNVHFTTPDHKIELTDKGKIQAIDAGHKIKEIIDAVWKNDRSPPHPLYFSRIAMYISPFARTRLTAKLIKLAIKDNVVFEREDPRLIEQEYGRLRTKEDLELIEQRQNAYSKFYFKCESRENGAQVYTRQYSFWETLNRHFEEDVFPPNVLIVGHGFQIRILLMVILHWTVEEFEAKRNLENCEIIELMLNDKNQYELKAAFV